MEPYYFLNGFAKKGKLVATVLNANKIPFEWYDFNAGKRNKHIEIQIKELSRVKPSMKSILTVWPEDEKLKKRVLDFLKEKELFFGINCWLF
jgi:hypothetical protein